MPIISPKIPSGLEELMRGLAKSVIKENPQNIYEFAAEYFENLLKERDGSCDQSYKKFATYKVYKKNKNARLKREKEHSNDVNDFRPDDINSFKRDVSYKRESSLEEFILPEANQPPIQALTQTLISSDAEVKHEEEEVASVTEDDDIKNMVLDDDMEKAALKIQSSFRGHKVRRDIKETKFDENITEQVEKEASDPEGETKEKTESELDDNDSRGLVECSVEGNSKDESAENDQGLIACEDKEPSPPPESEVDDDIANMVLDDDMEQAALKIQASFRGHKVRKEMKEPDATANNEDSTIASESEQHEESGVIEESGDLKTDENELVEMETIEDCPQPLDDEVEKEEKLSIQESVHENEIVHQSEESKEIEELENEIEESPELVEVNEEVIVKEISKDSLAEPESNRVAICEAEAENVENEATATDEEKLLDDESVFMPELLNVVEQEVESVLEEAIEAVDGQEIESNIIAENSEEVLVKSEECDLEEKLEEKSVEELTAEEENAEILEETKSSTSVDAEIIEKAESLKSIEAPESTEEVLNSVNEEKKEDEASVENIDTEIEKLEDATAEGDENDSENVETQEETPIAEGEGISEAFEESKSDNATDEVVEVPVGNENSGGNSITTEAEETEVEEVISETQQKAEEIEQDLPEGEDLSPQQVASIEKDDGEKLEKEPSVVDEAAENSENLIESENIIESNDNIEENVVESEAVNESENSEVQQPQEPIQNVEDGINIELNEGEPQEGLSALPNETENENLESDEAEYADANPVVEEICEKKFIEQLEPDQEIVESEIDENVSGRDSLNPIEGDQEILGESGAEVNDNLEKLPSGEIEYSTLKESMSEHDDGSPNESMDEGDNKSHELTDEKSIDGDSAGSNRQQSLDEVEDEVIDKAEEEKLSGSSVIRSSTVDDNEINESQQAEQLELHLNEQEPSETVESILHSTDISPIQLMDEVVNEYAGTVASELFSEGTEHLDQKSNLKESEDIAIDENQSSEHVEPKLSIENPFEAIEQPKSIDLSKESVQLLNEEIEPIIDEILQPETEESEIPEETEAPVDENIPTVSMDEKCPSLEKDEAPLPEEEKDENSSDPQLKPEEEDVTDMILDEEMEDAALKIQAAFRGHKVRKEQIVEPNEKSNESADEINIVIDQCSEQTQDTQDQEETEQQDTSADVEEIQESEAVDEEAEANEERQEDEEETVEEETAVEDETAEQDEDDPEAAPEEGETSEQQTNDDDDVANMVLDDEMENAALKIQATFRGHKTRKDIKKDEPQGESSTADEPQETKDSVQEVDDEIANMVLDDEMENAALMIQASFRGQKKRKDVKKESEGEGEEEKKEEDESEEKKEEEPETPKEETPASSSTEKTAKQLQDEEDIANIVMDAEMEQTAKKIQSVFRRKKGPKDSNESTGSSAGDLTDEEDETEEEEDPFKPNEEIETADRYYDDEKGSEHSTARYSSLDDGKYSLERNDEFYDNEPIGLNSTIDDINLMQGGGIFPEPSGSSSDIMLTGSSGEDRDPDRNSSYEKVPSTESQKSDEPISQEKAVESLDDDEKVIENFDFVANKDTAEAMYYSLKKNEIETQKRLSSEKQLSTEQQPETDDELAMSMEMMTNFENQSLEGEDDDDVVIGRPKPLSSSKRLKYGMSMDDRLLGSILSQDYTKKSRKEGYPDDGFDPLLEATLRNHNFLENLHEMSYSEDDKSPTYDDYPGDDEDQFDNFYDSKSIREKIMASSFSIADSDYFDPSHNKSIIDDDKIRTALETIHSTDSESTIASAATRIPLGERSNGKRTNHSMQYSSIGNAAIDKSLDEFIQSQELRIERFDEELEGYSSPPRKQESVDEWTDDTTTTYTDSDKKLAGAGGVIEIKLEQKTSFLTVDERRRTLHREDAIQRNSTREDEDSSKSSNVSGEKLLDKEIVITVETVVSSVTAQDSVIDTEIAVPVLDLTAKAKSPSQIPAKPHRMKRQHTMPVQIQTDVIRVIPKHLRKRIKSADGEKKKRGSK